MTKGGGDRDRLCYLANRISQLFTPHGALLAALTPHCARRTMLEHSSAWRQTRDMNERTRLERRLSARLVLPMTTPQDLHPEAIRFDQDDCL